MSDLRVLLLTFLPQGLATFFVGLAIFGLKANLRKVLVFGIIYGFIDYIGKNLFMNTGYDLVGNILPILFQILVYRYIFKIRISIGLTCALVSMILQGVSNILMLPIFNIFNFSLDVQKIIDSKQIWQLVFIGFLVDIPLYLISIIGLFKSITIINFSQKGKYL